MMMRSARALSAPLAVLVTLTLLGAAPRPATAAVGEDVSMTRPGEPAGTAYWTQQLGSGVTRAHVLLLFSESAEFQNHTNTA